MTDLIESLKKRDPLAGGQWIGITPAERDRIVQLLYVGDERLREAENIILRLTMDHNSTPNYVRGFHQARDYFAKHPPLPTPSCEQQPSEDK